jgi:GntR family transcriptional regulator of vanillate catabolism
MWFAPFLRFAGSIRRSPMVKRAKEKLLATAPAALEIPVRARPGKATAAAPAIVTLAQSVTDQLRTAIMEGRFLPGEKLNEMSLSAMLNVSRTPLRAALHSLAAEGLLEYIPNRGYSLRSMDTNKLIEIFDIRGALEGLAARLAADRGMNEAILADYRLALEAGDRIMAKGRLVRGDRDRFGEINGRLHDAILSAADSRMLVDMVRICHNIPIFSDRNVLWTDYEWLRRSHDDHHRILGAILLRDGPRAERLMREHVHAVKLEMKAQLDGAPVAAS